MWRGLFLLAFILLSSSFSSLGQTYYQSGFEGGDCPATNPVENDTFDPVLTYDKAIGTTIGRVSKDLSNGANREPRTGCFAGLITNEGTSTQTYDGSIITQLITFEPGYNYTVEVYAKVSTTANSTPKPGSLRIMGIPGSLAPTNVNATNSASRVIYAPSGTTSTFVPNNVLIDSYTSYSGTFSVTATTQYYIAFKLQSPSVTTGSQAKDFMIIDDINISSCPTTTLSALPTICSTYDPFNLTGGLPVGGVYSGTGVTTPAQNGTTNYQFDPSLAGVGTFTITYTAPNAPKSQGNSACPLSAYKATQPITVTAPTTLPPFAPVCMDGSSIPLTTGSPAGGVYSGTGVTGSNGNYYFIPHWNGVGTRTITYTVNGCSASQTITVKSTTLAAFSSVCANDAPFALTGGLPEGGVYSGTGVTTPAQNGTADYQFDPSLAGAGTRTITYTADGCTASRNITVIAVPTLSAFAAICEGTSRTLSGGAPAGGVYSSPTAEAVTQPTAGTYVFNAAKTLAPGTYQIDYTTSCGTASQTITITALPTLAAFSDICLNAAPLVLTGGEPAGGVYSGNGVSLVDGNYQFNPTTAGVGAKTITYAVNGCSTTQSINVKAIALTAFADICANAAPLTLSGGSPTGGVYSGTGVTSSTLNGVTTYQFNPATAGVGTHTIAYAVNGCSASRNIVVKTTILPAFGDVCLNAAAFTLNSGTPTGGTYSGPGVSVTSGVYQFTPATAGVGTHTIQYTANGCSASQSITVKAIALTSFADVCVNAAAFNLSGGSPANGVYSGPGVTLVSGTTYRFTPTTAGVGAHTITYTVNGCSASQNINVKAISLAAFADVCVNASFFNLSGGLPAGGTYSGTGVTLVSGAYRFTPSAAGVGTYPITYTVNGCSATQNITVKDIALAAFADVCANATPFFLTGGSPTGGVYSGTGVSLVGSQYQFNPAVGGTGSRTITYTVNGCSASQNINVKAIALTAFSDVCANAAAFTLTNGSPAGGVYSGTGVTLNNGVYQFTPTSVAAGTYTITYAVNGCSASQSITVKPISLAAFNPVCANTTAFTLTGGSPAGGVYSGTGVTVNNGVYQFNPVAVGNGTYTITYAVNGCSASQSITVKEISLAAFPDVCANEAAFTLTGGLPLGGIYSGPGVTAIGSSGSYRFTPSAALVGTRTITYTVNGCSASQSITVKAVPTLAAYSPICQGTSLTLNTGTPTGGVYSSTTAGAVTQPTAGTYVFNAAKTLAAGTYQITYQATNGCSISQSITIIATPTLAALSTMCQSDAAITLTGGAPAGGVYSGPGVTLVSGTTYRFSPATAGAGVHTISYTTSCGVATRPLTVIATPTLAAFAKPVCTNGSLALTGASPAGGTWSGPGVTGSTFSAAAALLTGSGPYIITYTTSCGSASQPLAVTNTTTWTGEVSSNWFDARNWTACVPDPTINGIVPVPSNSRPYPVISRGSTGEVLTLTVSGKWTLPDGNLDLYGDFDTSGGGTFEQKAGTFTLKGLNQAIAGATFYNLTSGTAGIKTLTGTVSVTNLLSMQLGMMETSSSYMADLGTTGSISETDASYVLGRVRSIRTVPTSGTQTFGNIGLSLAVNTGLSPGTTTVMRVTGPNTAQSGLPGSTSILRYFDLSATGVSLTSPPMDMNATFAYREAELNGITEANLGLFRSTNNGLSWGQIGGTVSESANSFAGVRLSSLGRLTLGDKGLPLPVSLMSFSAKRQQQTTLLNWSTASEKNNDGFSIETSHNGVSFQTIGFVKSLAGNSQTVQNYSFVDRANRPAGVQYYRLQQVDLDGKAGYSPVQTVVVQAGGLQMSAYPNPFHGTLTVDVSLVAASPVTIVMHDALGREVYRSSTKMLLAGTHSLLVAPDSKAQGMYMLNISTNNGPTQHIRVVQQ